MEARKAHMLAGDPSQWLSHLRSLEERMAEAVEAAWPICIKPLQAKKNAMTHEDHITNHLVHALRKTKLVPGLIVPQYKLMTIALDGIVSLSSSIDFVLTIGDNEDIYLACECKRLNVPYKSGLKGLVGEYVDDGLMRFVSGQYSNGLPLAMMLGYVMNARADRARRGLARAMKYRAKVINLQSTADAPLKNGKPIRFVTAHLCTAGKPIEVSHTLLAWP
jgi:hypothetical protein